MKLFGKHPRRRDRHDTAYLVAKTARSRRSTKASPWSVCSDR